MPEKGSIQNRIKLPKIPFSAVSALSRVCGCKMVDIHDVLTSQIVKNAGACYLPRMSSTLTNSIHVLVGTQDNSCMHSFDMAFSLNAADLQNKREAGSWYT